MTVLRRALLAAFVLGLGLSITLSETALTLSVLLLLWTLREGRGRGAARWPLWQPVAAFSVVSVVSALVSGHVRAGMTASKGLLLAAALYVTVNALSDSRAAHRFLSGLLIVTAVAAAVGILQAGVCPGSAPDYGSPMWLYHRCYRGRGFFSIYMTLAGVLNLVLLATLPRLLPEGAFFRWLTLPWLVDLGGLALTYTRGAWVGFVVGALTLLPTTRRARWLLVGGLIALGVAAVASPPHLRERVLTMGDPDDPTVRERVYMWRSSVAMWREHPWLGVGPGGVKREYERYALPEAVKKRTGHVHNTPLQILVERGLIGLVAWLWIWGAFYRRSIRLLRRLSGAEWLEWTPVAGSLAAITGFLIAGLSEYNFGDSEVVMVAWSVMALPFVGTGGDTCRNESDERTPT